MKKLLLSALALTLAFSMTACGGSETPESSIQESFESQPIATEAPTETPAEAPAATEAPAENNASGESMGTVLLGAFNDIMADEAADHTPLSIADKLITNEIIPFAGGAIEVEPGLLSGFVNYEVTGFDKGAMFCPMIGSIPFVGYIFELPADADVEGFMTSLKENANLAWNICVEADEMICEANGSTVMFLMSPKNIEE